MSSTQRYPGRLFCSSRCVWEDAVEWGHVGPRILGELRNDLPRFQSPCKWCEFVEERGGIRRAEESGLQDGWRPDCAGCSATLSKRRTCQDQDGMTRRGSEHSVVQTRAREAFSSRFFFFLKSAGYYHLFPMSRLTLLAASVAPPAAGLVEDAAYVCSL